MNDLHLKYFGDVQISYILTDKIIEKHYHNSGLPYLMKMFAMAITGNRLNDYDVPMFLDLRKRIISGEDVTWETILTQPLPLSGKSYAYASDQNPPNWVAKFTASISHEILKSDVSEDSGDVYRLYLYTEYDPNSKDDPYHDIAFLNVDAKDLAKIVPGTQAIVDWTVQVRNQ